MGGVGKYLRNAISCLEFVCPAEFSFQFSSAAVLFNLTSGATNAFECLPWRSGKAVAVGMAGGLWRVKEAEATGFAVRAGMFAQSVGVWKSNCASTLWCGGSSTLNLTTSFITTSHF